MKKQLPRRSRTYKRALRLIEEGKTILAETNMLLKVAEQIMLSGNDNAPQ